MAARRVAKSSVDWAKFASLVPEHYNHEFRHLKVANDKFVGRVNALPASVKPIDFEKYKAAGVPAAIVDQFANQYKTLEVAYPKDLANQKQRVDKEEKFSLEASKHFVALNEEIMQVAEEYLAAAERVPVLGEMTKEMYLDYFPERVLKGEENALDMLGYEKEDHPAQDIPFFPALQDDVKTWPDRIRDYLAWHFCHGEWQDAYKKANSDLFPNQPELEEGRIERLRLDRIDNEATQKALDSAFPWWITEQEIEERGLSREKFHAAERLVAQAHAEKTQDALAKGK